MQPNSIEAFWNLSPRERVSHWGQRDPWKGTRAHKPETIVPRDVSTIDGHIVRCPLLVSRPCFGEVSAFARHWGRVGFYDPRTGAPRKTRCGRCACRDACGEVARKRIKADPDIQRAFKKYQAAGGHYGLEHPKAHPEVTKAFDTLLNALKRHGGFRSINDEAVLEDYARRHAADKVKDAARKQRERRKKYRAGQMDDMARDVILRHGIYREQLLKAALADPGWLAQAHVSFRKLGPASSRAMRDVWICLQEIRVAGAKESPSTIARLMCDRWPAVYKNHNSLRQGVRGHLRRIARLEHAPAGGPAPVWPPFDLIAEIEDELASTTSYSIAA